MWIERTDTSLIARWWWTVDRVTLGCILTLVGLGLFIVASASLPEAAKNGHAPYYYFKRHLAFAFVSLVLMFSISLLPKHLLPKLAVLGLFLAFILVCMTLFFGDPLNGARRWLPIAGHSLQPSEILKPLFVVVIALVLAQKFSHPTMRVLQISGLLLGAALLPLLLQPDVSQSLLLVAVWMMQILLAGYSIWLFVGSGVAAIIGLAVAFLSYPHVASRVTSFLTPTFDPYSQVGISIRAFMNGGFFGRGANEGELKSSLADSYADFIFAAVGEEFGFFVSAILVALFALIVLRGMARMLHEEEPFAFLAASGLLCLFCLQTLMNMTVNLGMAPTTGVTLPFVSYGGSAMLGTAMTMGFVLALTRRVQFSQGMRVFRHGSAV
ncbi:MAG: putative peptidoglycan glycosyltransferase FtsW [Pseudomonadota bacterium]